MKNVRLQEVVSIVRPLLFYFSPLAVVSCIPQNRVQGWEPMHLLPYRWHDRAVSLIAVVPSLFPLSFWIWEFLYFRLIRTTVY